MMLSIAEESPDRVVPLLQTALSDPNINNALIADSNKCLADNIL